MAKAPVLFTLYCITNTTNGKRYIGITTKPLLKRYDGHLRRARTGWKGRLYSAMRRDGVSQFSAMELAHAFTFEDLLELERIAIAQHNTFDKSIGYNMTAGGEGALGRPMTDHCKAKLREGNKNRVITDEYREWSRVRFTGANNHRYGATWTEETRIKVKAGHDKARAEGRLTGGEWTDERRTNASTESIARHRDNPDKPIVYDGKSLPISEWSRITGIDHTTIWRRLNRYGFSVERALTEPVDRKRRCGPLGTNSKLTEEIVKDMRIMYVAGESPDDIGAKFKVDGTTAGYAIQGKTWACVPGAVKMRTLSEAHKLSSKRKPRSFELMQRMRDAKRAKLCAQN